MKVVIACGTHIQGFNRLLDVGAGIERDFPQADVRYQFGHSPGWSEGPKRHAFMPPADFAALLMESHLIISQPSPGIGRVALRSGAAWAVLPRRRSLGEHVDDHQVRFARYLVERGLAVSMEDLTPKDLMQLQPRKATSLSLVEDEFAQGCLQAVTTLVRG